MSVRVVLWLAMLCGLGATGCTGMRGYEQGLPKRVEVEKTTGEGRTEVRAFALEGGRVHVTVAERRPTTVTRRIVYGTVEERHEYNPNIAWELLEVPFGFLMLLPMGVLVSFGVYDRPESRTVRRDVTQDRLTLVFGAVNPAQSLFSPVVVRDPTSDEEMFYSDPVTTRYAVASPRVGVKVRYVLRREDGSEISAADVTTDEQGSFFLESVPVEATRIEVTIDGGRFSRPLRFPATKPKPKPAEPTAPEPTAPEPTAPEPTAPEPTAPETEAPEVGGEAITDKPQTSPRSD